MKASKTSEGDCLEHNKTVVQTKILYFNSNEMTLMMILMTRLPRLKYESLNYMDSHSLLYQYTRGLPF